MRVVAVLKGYPRLSETFVAQEFLALEARGFHLHVVSLRRPTDRVQHPIHGRIQAAVTYLPEYLHDEPLRVLRALRAARRRPGFGTLLALWWHDFRRDPTPNRVRRLGQALVLAHEVLREGDLVYAHFVHTPGSVARYAARFLDLPLALSAHAKDIWTTPAWEKREKLADARFTVTCTASGHAHLRALASRPNDVHLVYHGVDLTALPSPPERPARDGTRADDPVRLLTVARAVPKKGLDVLVGALALLPPELHWRWLHVGGGDVEPLRRRARALGLDARISFAGAKARPEVIAAYRDADLFVLPSRVADDGDRDGLPNVLLEAASQGLPLVTTPVGAITELVRDGEEGLLVPPDDPSALAAALVAAIRDPAQRRRQGLAGAARVRQAFEMTAGIDRLAGLLTGATFAQAA